MHDGLEQHWHQGSHPAVHHLTRKAGAQLLQRGTGRRLLLLRRRARRQHDTQPQRGGAADCCAALAGGSKAGQITGISQANRGNQRQHLKVLRGKVEGGWSASGDRAAAAATAEGGPSGGPCACPLGTHLIGKILERREGRGALCRSREHGERALESPKAAVWLSEELRTVVLVTWKQAWRLSA